MRDMAVLSATATFHNLFSLTGILLTISSTTLTFVNGNGDDVIEVSQMFHEVTSPLVGLDSNGLSWTVTSKLSCAVQCLSESPVCSSFYYEQQTRLCVSGSIRDMAHGLYSASPLSGASIYQKKSSCDETDSFFTAVLNDVQACLYFEDSYVTYSEAHQRCADLQADLLTLGELEKLEDVDQLGLGAHLWIGMTNQHLGHSFTWIDTNNLLTQWEQTNLFELYQPDNSAGNGNSCCYYNRDWVKLDDSGCSEAKAIICKRPLN